MINTNEDAFICDMAETYGILDYRSQPLKLIATLAFGLRDDSRIKMEIAGLPAEKQTLLLAGISDKLTCAYWTDKNSEPDLILTRLYGLNKKSNECKEEITVFDSPEAFEKRRKEILEKAVD